MQLAERLGRTDILAHALNNVGTAESHVDLSGGQSKIIRSLALARAENLDEHIARALTNLASTSLRAHDFDVRTAGSMKARWRIGLRKCRFIPSSSSRSPGLS